MKQFLPAFLVICLVGLGRMHAQDNVAPRVNEKMRVTGGEKTDFIFTRAFMVPAMDSVPFDISRSGIYSIGIGYGFSIFKGLELKIEPRATWHKMFFRPEGDRWFPAASPDSAVIYQKQRAFYVEMPVGLKFKLFRNKVSDRYQVLMEAGFSTGVNLGSASKTRSEVNVDSDPELEGKLTRKVNKIADLNLLRYGPYLRVGTRYVSVFALYRLTDLYRSDRSFQVSPTQTRPYPTFPHLEIGLSLTI